jgi:hypothetical protein
MVTGRALEADLTVEAFKQQLETIAAEDPYIG